MLQQLLKVCQGSQDGMALEQILFKIEFEIRNRHAQKSKLCAILMKRGNHVRLTRLVSMSCGQMREALVRARKRGNAPAPVGPTCSCQASYAAALAQRLLPHAPTTCTRQHRPRRPTPDIAPPPSAGRNLPARQFCAVPLIPVTHHVAVTRRSHETLCFLP